MAPKLFYRIRRLRQKNLVVVREYVKSIEVYMENTKDSHLFAFCRVVSEYTKSILSHMEKMYKENKRT